MVCETIRGTEQIDLPPRPTFIYRFFNSGDMARRSRKVPPTTRQLRFQLGTGEGQVTGGYVDIAQCLSLLNRKFFRQGQEYYVESWTISSTMPCRASLVYIHENWVSTNAWVKAFRTWMKSQEQLEDFDDIKGRYHDFKVFMDTAHAGFGMSANLLPASFDFVDAAAISPTISANWQESHIQIPNVDVAGTPTTVEYNLHILGPDVATSKGCIEGYANSRSRPMQDDPNIVNAISWMNSAFDDGDNLEEIRSDVVTENDSPPYLIDAGETAFEFYPGGSNALQGAGNGVGNTPVLALNPALGSFASKGAGGFPVPCGLILIVGSIDAGQMDIVVNIAPGSAKGVMARPMQDVN